MADASDASQLAVRDGRIVYVGDGQGVQIDAASTIDLDGRFVMHGFIDNHVHFFEGGAALASVDLRDATTPNQLAERIARYAADLPSGSWVLQGNWDHTLWGGELPDRRWIDALTPEHPVFVIRLDGHMGLANSLALQRAGVNANSVAAEGGEIVRDADGRLTGVLKDNAMNTVLDVIPALSEAQVLGAFKLAQSHALSLGITHVHAVTANPTETRMFNSLRQLQQRKQLKMRITFYSPIEDWSAQAERQAQFGNGDDWLRDLGVKGFVDGSLGSGTAWFYQAYSDEPGNVGLPLTPPATLHEYMAQSDAAGMKLAIHAIGDRAIDSAIDAMTDIAGDQVAARRYRIEHFQHPTKKAIKAIAQHGIIASMQPYHAIDDGRWAQGRIGAQRIESTYAFRSILDAGAWLTFGSDWPVAPLSPLHGVYAAVTRRTTDGANPDGWQPAQKITVEEALTAYTVTNAYAGFDDAHAGTLVSGHRADLVVLSDDPRKVAPDALTRLRVEQTIVDGEVVFRADAAN